MTLFAFGRDMAEQKRGEHSLAREQRKLAAILAAEVVGYSRLMGWPRAGRKSLEPVLARYGRARAKLTGDSALVGFARNRPLCPALCSANAVVRRCQRS